MLNVQPLNEAFENIEVRSFCVLVLLHTLTGVFSGADCSSLVLRTVGIALSCVEHGGDIVIDDGVADLVEVSFPHRMALMR